MNSEAHPAVVPFEVVSQVTRLLEPLSDEDRAHVLSTIATWFRLPMSRPLATIHSTPLPSSVAISTDERFQGREEVSPKQFIGEKDPRTESERMACLAYYLTHFRDTPQFATNDLSRLNTEAAQRKFSNAAVTASNAMRDGLFVPAAKPGLRQLSAMGERFVQALPDREAAKLVKRRLPARRARRNGSMAGTELGRAAS
jgi:hypothetical protein